MQACMCPSVHVCLSACLCARISVCRHMCSLCHVHTCPHVQVCAGVCRCVHGDSGVRVSRCARVAGMHVFTSEGPPAHSPAVEVADVLHVAEDDCFLAGHGRGHVRAVVQVLDVVLLQELQLAHKGLLRAQQLLDDRAGQGKGKREARACPRVCAAHHPWSEQAWHSGGGRQPHVCPATATTKLLMPHLPAPHLSLILYSSSDTASPGNSGASVGPHSGDSC